MMTKIWIDPSSVTIHCKNRIRLFIGSVQDNKHLDFGFLFTKEPSGICGRQLLNGLLNQTISRQNF